MRWRIVILVFGRQWSAALCGKSAASTFRGESNGWQKGNFPQAIRFNGSLRGGDFLPAHFEIFQRDARRSSRSARDRFANLSSGRAVGLERAGCRESFQVAIRETAKYSRACRNHSKRPLGWAARGQRLEKHPEHAQSARGQRAHEQFPPPLREKQGSSAWARLFGFRCVQVDRGSGVRSSIRRPPRAARWSRKSSARL